MLRQDRQEGEDNYLDLCGLIDFYVELYVVYSEKWRLSRLTKTRLNYYKIDRHFERFRTLSKLESCFQICFVK